jgi:hypothetical protein
MEQHRLVLGHLRSQQQLVLRLLQRLLGILPDQQQQAAAAASCVAAAASSSSSSIRNRVVPVDLLLKQQPLSALPRGLHGVAQCRLRLRLRLLLLRPFLVAVCGLQPVAAKGIHVGTLQ